MTGVPDTAWSDVVPGVTRCQEVRRHAVRSRSAIGRFPVKVERFTVELDGFATPVTAERQTPARRRGAPVLLTPGAGGDLDGDGLVALATVLAELGHTVVRANLPHNETRRRPPKAERSTGAYRQLLAGVAARVDADRSWIVGGKSYGGRVASMAVAGGMTAAALLLYGYPLHPPGKPEQLRVGHWPAIAVPCLFLQGERDTFSSPELLAACVHKLPRRPAVVVVPGGDHSLHVTGRASADGTPSNPPTTIASLRDELRNWLAGLDG